MIVQCDPGDPSERGVFRDGEPQRNSRVVTGFRCGSIPPKRFGLRAAARHGNAGFLENRGQRADCSEAALEQVDTHKAGNPEPVYIVENRAGFDPESKAQQDEEAGEDPDDAFYVHVYP